VLDDLPRILLEEIKNSQMTLNDATLIVESIRSDVKSITKDLFRAYENEYSIFCPMANCFEIFGLDFLVDVNYSVHLLEVNPGPDFKQTGEKLSSVINELWKQTFSLIFEQNLLFYSEEKSFSEMDDILGQDSCKKKFKEFSLVYSKEWSVSKLKSGISFS
jgi:hypothetical protein